LQLEEPLFVYAPAATQHPAPALDDIFGHEQLASLGMDLDGKIMTDEDQACFSALSAALPATEFREVDLFNPNTRYYKQGIHSPSRRAWRNKEMTSSLSPL